MLRNSLPSGDALLATPPGVMREGLGEASETGIFRRFRDLQSLVDGLLASWVGTRLPLLPRQSHRVTGRYELAVTPLEDGSLQQVGDTRRVQAWDISPDGLSFTHRNSLAFRMVAVTIPLPDGDVESVVTQLKWCRFSRDHIYRSGGQFQRVHQFGWEPTLDFDTLPLG